MDRHPQVFSGLIGAALTGLVSLLVSAYVSRRRLGYTPLYDQPVNQGDLVQATQDFDRRKFTVEFPGRLVVHYKVRDNRDYHKEVAEAQGQSGKPDFKTPEPGHSDEFSLPATTLERGEGLEVLTLLVSNPRRRDWTGGRRSPVTS